MKALVLREHGGMDRMRIETDFPDPEIGSGADREALGKVVVRP